LIALVFLYFIAAIFIYGGELNASIVKAQKSSALPPEAEPSPARVG
jgi:membrane protein